MSDGNVTNDMGLCIHEDRGGRAYMIMRKFERGGERGIHRAYVDIFLVTSGCVEKRSCRYDQNVSIQM